MLRPRPRQRMTIARSPRAYLPVHLLPMLAQEAHKVLLLDQRALLDDLHIGLWPLEHVDALEHKVSDLYQ